MCQQWIAAASESGLFLLIILFGNKYNLSISWCIVFHKLRLYEVFGTVDLPFGMGGCSCFFLEDWVHTNECSRNKYFPFNWLLEKLYNYNLLYFKISFYSFKTVLATVLKKKSGRFNYCYCYITIFLEDGWGPETGFDYSRSHGFWVVE